MDNNLDEAVYSIQLDSEGNGDSSEGDGDSNLSLTPNPDVFTSTLSSGHQSEETMSNGDMSDNNSEISFEIKDSIPSPAIVLPKHSLKNYEGDAENEEDYENDWSWILGCNKDNCFSTPFTGNSGDLIMNTDEWTPEVFFQQFLGSLPHHVNCL